MNSIDFLVLFLVLFGFLQYDIEDTPDARFTYDVSPMAVVISERSKKFYEFITSICAVIGGTFTVVGLVSGVLSMVLKKSA